MAKGTKHINRGVKVNDDREVFVNLVSEGPVAGAIGWGEMVFFLDEDGNKLKVRLKYSDGTLKNGELALT